MAQLSNGYVMGYLCGYMRNNMDPRTFGYHRGYTFRKTAAESAGQAVNTTSAVDTKGPEQLGNKLDKPEAQVWMQGAPASYPKDTVVDRNAKPQPIVT